MDGGLPSRSYEDYTVGWICAIEPEFVAAKAVLDEVHIIGLPTIRGDSNSYLLGRIGIHNVVIASLPSGTNTKSAAARVASHMERTFLWLQFRFMVGVGGGVPNYEAGGIENIHLGDVVVSTPGQSSGVVEYDLGKIKEGAPWVELKGVLNKPPEDIRAAVARLRVGHHFEVAPLSSIIADTVVRHPILKTEYEYQGAANDILFQAGYCHIGDSCDECESGKIVLRPLRTLSGPRIHYGVIGSGNQVINDTMTRDYWHKKEQIICFETTAAGVMDRFPCLVIRGICNYADSHSNKRWQPYAALTAAAFAKDLILSIEPVTAKLPARTSLTSIFIQRPEVDMGTFPQSHDKDPIGRKDGLETLEASSPCPDLMLANEEIENNQLVVSDPKEDYSWQSSV